MHSNTWQERMGGSSEMVSESKTLDTPRVKVPPVNLWNYKYFLSNVLTMGKDSLYEIRRDSRARRSER